MLTHDFFLSKETKRYIFFKVLDHMLKIQYKKPKRKKKTINRF